MGWAMGWATGWVMGWAAGWAVGWAMGWATGWVTKVVMGAWWLFLGLGLVPWQNGWTSLGVDGQILQGSSRVLAIALLGLNPWSDHSLVKGQLFGAGGQHVTQRE